MEQGYLQKMGTVAVVVLLVLGFAVPAAFSEDKPNIVVIWGVTSYLRLPREASPDVEIPFVMVYAPYYGTSPADMEHLVTRKLEQQLKGLADLEEMSSSSSEGVSTVVLEFTTDVEMSDALQKVRDAVELSKPELPQDVKDDLIVFELSSEDWPIMSIVLSADYDLVKLKKVAEDLQEIEAPLGEVLGFEGIGVDVVVGLESRFEVAHVDDGHRERPTVVEAPLGNSPHQGHLAAFEGGMEGEAAA